VVENDRDEPDLGTQERHAEHANPRDAHIGVIASLPIQTA
jgi:hypothetical protein